MVQKPGMLLYLNTAQVKTLCDGLDTVSIIKDVFSLHGTQQTVLPNEAYLKWQVSPTESARSLNMPAFIGGKYNVAGTKIINANIANPTRGIPRADGITLLFDTETGQIKCIMEGAYISALRTASVSALGIDLLSTKEPLKLAIIGLGVLGEMHLALLTKRYRDIQTIYLFDQDRKRTEILAKQYKDHTIVQANNAEEAVRDCNVIVTATTTSTGYIKPEWMRPGSLFVHISLDDLLPEAIKKADKLIVDDWNLVMTDTNRIFGRMYHDGTLHGPDDKTSGHPSIYAEFADIVNGKKSARTSDSEIIIFNPFGLAIEDIGIAKHVYEIAIHTGHGTYINR